MIRKLAEKTRKRFLKIFQNYLLKLFHCDAFQQEFVWNILCYKRNITGFYTAYCVL